MDDDHTTTTNTTTVDVQQQDTDEEFDAETDEEEHHIDLIDDEDDDEEEELEEDAFTTTTTTTISPTPTTTTTSILKSDATTEFKKPPAFDDSRRLFQRLWTDEDEIELLQGFLEYSTQRGTNGSSHHHHDTTAFYDQIKGKLQLEFNKNQLVEKLRRLKKKYRNVLSKISSGKECVFKSSHDQATFDLSCKIWGVETGAATPSVLAAGNEDEEFHNPNPGITVNNLNEHNGNEIGDPEKKLGRSRKRSRANAVKLEENWNNQQQFGQNLGAGGSNLDSAAANVVEETVKSSLLPLFKELINNLSNGNGSSGNSRGLGLGLMNMNPFGGLMNFQIGDIGDMSDEKWKKQHILELEVYSKRLELMQDQIKSKLEELKSMGN